MRKTKESPTRDSKRFQGSTTSVRSVNNENLGGASYDIDALFEEVVVNPHTYGAFLIKSLRNQIEERNRLLVELLSKQF